MMRRVPLAAAIVAAVACAATGAVDQTLVDHLAQMLRVPATGQSNVGPIDVIRFALDVTNDGKAELFLGTTWAGSKRGLLWVVYTPGADGRYTPLGVLEFGYSSFYYSAATGTIFAPRGGGPGGDFAYFRVGKDGIREVEDAALPPPLGPIDEDLVKLRDWQKKGRPPVYRVSLQELRASPSPQWRDVDSKKVEPSVGRLDTLVSESGDCSAERLLGEYRAAGCLPAQ